MTNTKGNSDEKKGRLPNREMPGIEEGERMQCQVCGYTYDPGVGDPVAGIGPGVGFDQLSECWICPVCGAQKILFVSVL